MAPSLELRNVQSTAFNILWYKTYSTINYRITIDPPVGDFENGLLFENEDDGEDQSDYLSIYEADSVTDYTITLTAILADGVETDPVSETVQTAFIMEPPSVSDITETDLAEAVFTTTGQQVTVNQSLCALSYASLESSETVASACDFEDGTMCGWYQDRQSAKSYSWRIDTERSVSKSDKSKVLVAPYRRASSNDEAKLYSPMLSGPKCLELEVLMFRKSVASFTVSVLSEKGISKLVELNGPQGQQWVPLQHSIFLPETLNYKIELRALRGEDWRSSISVDNIRITDGPCWQ